MGQIILTATTYNLSSVTDIFEIEGAAVTSVSEIETFPKAGKRRVRAPESGRLILFSCYLRGGSPLPVSVYAEPSDFRFQRLAWYPELRGCTGRSGYAAMGLGESGFDHLHFTIR